MNTVTASTKTTRTKPMPILPICPDLDSLQDDETGLSTRLFAALFSAAHTFVIGVRAKRDFATAYVSALTYYLQTFGACEFFGILAIEVKAGRADSAAERARCVRSRRAARRQLDALGKSLPESIHKALVTFAVLGGRCGRLSA